MKGKRKKRRRLPPGQRLIGYSGLAGLLVLSQGYSQPAELPRAGGLPVVQQAVLAPPFHLTEELRALEEAIKEQSAKPGLRTGVFVVEPATGKYADQSAHESFAAASMIKVPVLVALLSAVDRKEVSLNQILTMKQEDVAGGSGFLQWRPVGSQFPVAAVAELMITHSDNTATNMIINLLGGKSVLNPQFAGWGLTQTRINNPLPDFDGTNRTSPYDLAYLLGLVQYGGQLSAESKDFMMRIMQRTRTRTLLPMGLGLGARIAHKTGDIGGMVGDAGIVSAPGGQRYIVVAQVERPHNDVRANLLIRRLSRSIYSTMVPEAVFPAPAPQKPARHRLRHHRHRH